MLDFILKKFFEKDKSLDTVLDLLQKRDHDGFNKAIKLLKEKQTQSLLEALNAFQKHDFQTAKKLLAPLLKEKKGRNKALLVFGFLHYERHDYDLALQAFRKYMEVEPTHMDVGIFICELLIKQNHKDKAHPCLQSILASNYLDVELCTKIGRYFLHLKDGEFALKAFHKIFLIANPTLKEVSLILDSMVIAGAFKMADELFKTLVSYKYKNSSELYASYGTSYRVKKKYDRAKELIKKAIELDVNSSIAHSHLSQLYVDLKEPKRAIKYAKKALEKEHDNPKFHTALALLYSETEQYEKSIESNMKAIELEPNVESYSALAMNYFKVRQFDLAEKSNNEALSLDPYNTNVHWNQAFVHLVQGEFEKGFFHYDLRFRPGTGNKIKLPLGGVNLWNKESLAGKTIFVYDEQGLGDIIVFIRLLPLLKKMAKRVVFHVRTELVALCKNNDLFKDIEILNKEIVPTTQGYSFDYQIPLMSLPYRLEVKSNAVPFREGYLNASDEMVNKWEALLDKLTSKKIKVALTWSGNPEYGYDKYRSLKIAQIESLVRSHPEIAFFAVTKGLADDDLRDNYPTLPLISVAEHLDSFDDTAGLLHHMDLVITVDTVISHLASAMNKPTWVLIYHIPFWIWGTEGESYWYKNTKIYRQEKALEWNPILTQVNEDLRIFKEQKEGILS